MQFRRNVQFIGGGWTFGDAVTCAVIAFLLAYRWDDKPVFLRVAFPATFGPLLALALFFGYIDEWRGYYEAYPIGLALIVDSCRRLRAQLANAARQCDPPIVRKFFVRPSTLLGATLSQVEGSQVRKLCKSPSRLPPPSLVRDTPRSCCGP